MIFKRFPDFSAMQTFAREITSDGQAWEIEAHIYTDTEVSYRPGITLFPKDNWDAGYMLRWDAFSDERDIDFIGKGSRVNARNRATEMVNVMLALLTMED